MQHIQLLSRLGVNYITYSHISAKILRKCLKPEFQKDVKLRDSSHIQIYKFKNNKKLEEVDTLMIGTKNIHEED